MQLRYSTTSPYARKVRIAIHELNLSASVERVPTDPWNPNTDLPDHNPLGKVPTLLTDDGVVLFDSPVICEYLDAEYSPGRLFPAEQQAHLSALRLQAAADGALDAAVLRLLEGRRPEQYQWMQWVERQSRTVKRTLDWLEAEVAQARWSFDIGALSVVALLGYLDFRFSDDPPWRTTCPKLTAWFDAVSVRPSVRATVPTE